MPRCLTVLSSFVWPSRRWTAEIFGPPVARQNRVLRSKSANTYGLQEERREVAHHPRHLELRCPTGASIPGASNAGEKVAQAVPAIG